MGAATAATSAGLDDLVVCAVSQPAVVAARVPLIVGLGRDAWGESLSAHERIRGQALTLLLSLARDFAPAENDTPTDNRDPYRRVERAHPEIRGRLTAGLGAPLPELAATMLSLLEAHLSDRVPAVPSESLAAVRALAAKL